MKNEVTRFEYHTVRHILQLGSWPDERSHRALIVNSQHNGYHSQRAYTYKQMKYYMAAKRSTVTIVDIEKQQKLHLL